MNHCGEVVRVPRTPILCLRHSSAKDYCFLMEKNNCFSITSSNGSSASTRWKYPAWWKRWMISTNWVTISYCKNFEWWYHCRSMTIIITTEEVSILWLPRRHQGGGSRFVLVKWAIDLPACTELYSRKDEEILESEVCDLENNEVRSSLVVKHEISKARLSETVISLDGATDIFPQNSGCPC